MRPLRRDRVHPYKTFVLDIETTGLGEPVARQALKGRPPRQLVCCLYDGKTYLSFWGEHAIERCLRWVIDQGEDAEVFAHYGGGFDFRFAHDWLFDEVRRSGKGWRIVTSGSYVIVCGGEIDGMKLRLVDSFRLLPDGLAAIGREVGIPKSEWEHSFHDDRLYAGGPALTGALQKHRFRLHAPICYDALERYCRNDCLVLWKGLELIRAFAATQGISLRNTIASTATASIRKRLDLDTIAWAPPAVTEECALACFGGRVENFAESCDHDFVFDLQSSYPRAMLESLPWRYVETRERYRKGMIGIVEATVEVPPDCEIPVLPFRLLEGRDKGRVFFPTGTWRGWFYSRELDYAAEVGAARIKAVHTFHRFSGGHVLERFIQKGWKARRVATGFLRYALKIWMNATYGKLNEKVDHEEILIHPSADKIICKRHRERAREPNEGPCQCRLPIVPRHGLYAVESRHDPAFRAPWAAAAVTGIARVQLHRGFMEAKRKEGRISYSDTDSIFTNVRLETGKELGDFAFEREIVNGRFIGPKMYAFTCIKCDKKDRGGKPLSHPHDVVKAKGFTKLTREEFDRIDRCECAGGWRSGTAFGCPECGGASLEEPGSGRGIHRFARTEGFKEAVARGRVAYRRIEVVRQLRETRPKRAGDRPWTVEELGKEWRAA